MVDKELKASTSQLVYPVRVIKHVLIPMRDGVSLSADLYLPDGPGRFPVVFDCYPYRKDDTMASYVRQHHYLAKRGYAAVRLDVRGTGSSGGVATDEYSVDEQLDCVEAIHWMSQQPWCNGNVGMFGLSYGGVNSIQVAMHRPQELKAICPMFFMDDRYNEDHYRGGSFELAFDLGYYGLFMLMANAMPPYPECVGDQWAQMWEERLKNEPWILRWLENQTYNDYWKRGSLREDYAAVQCAVYIFGGWADGWSSGNLRVFEHLNCPKKMLIGPWMHTLPDISMPGPRVDHLQEMIRFFDHWLKGIDNGVMDEPPITLYVQEFDKPHATRSMTSGFWRHEPGWPLDRVSERSLYLTPAGTFVDEPLPTADTHEYEYRPTTGIFRDIFYGAPPYLLTGDQRFEDPWCSNWTSDPLTESIEILGYPKLSLFISCSTDIASVFVRLIDVAPDGAAAFICKGLLNLTHRESHEHPSAMTPDKMHEVTVPLDATSWVFGVGHRIRIGISGADFPNALPSPKPYTAKLYLGGATASRLLLPIAGPQTPKLGTPDLPIPGPIEAAVDIQGEPRVWKVTRDVIEQKAEVFLRNVYRGKVGDRWLFCRGCEVTAVASDKNPAQVSVRGLSWVTLYWPDRTIETRARGQIETSATALHVTLDLDITMDEMPHFSRRWVRSIPRNLQ